MNTPVKNLFLLLLIFSMTQTVGQSPLKPFPLADVKITEGVFYEAQQTDLKYILELDTDKLLAPFLIDAGLPAPKTAYGNWETTGLDGHIGGHYLSALSFMYAATGNTEVKKRLDYMIEQLNLCQQKNGNGYIGGIPDGKNMWAEIELGKINANNFSLNGKWVPLYNIHKLYAGLRDAYQVAGNQQARMLFIKLCDWFLDISQNLNDEQIQEILRSEHGGMNEVFADAYEITRDKKYLNAAIKLSHKAILNPLLKRQDNLTGLHANTQIPKVIGFKKVADLTGDTTWHTASDFFWNTVVNNRSVSIGGNSVREHFHPANDFTSMIESNQGPETCNTYNMLRLTKSLFLSNPDSRYLDYYERATYNHILSSQRPTGGFVYFTPMHPQHYRVYSAAQKSFWCCVGSGLENHGKYGELIYSHTSKDLYVNLFLPSTLQWREKGLTLQQQTKFPEEEKTNLHITLKKTQRFRIYLRYPHWVKQGELIVSLNGKVIPINNKPGSYFFVEQKWKTGDILSITLPMHTKMEYLPDQSSWVSFVHGPIVLAAPTDTTHLDGLIADDSRMGHVAEGQLFPISETPVIISNGNNQNHAQPISGKVLTFSLQNIVSPMNKKIDELNLIPFYKLHNARYIIYWPIATSEQFEKTSKELHLREQANQELMKRIVDQVMVGEQQPEVEHNFKSEQTEAGSSHGKTWRRSTTPFSYDFQNTVKAAKTIRIMYEHETDAAVNFDVVVNNQKLKAIPVNAPSETNISSIDFVLPEEAQKENITVRIIPHQNISTEKIFQILVLK